MRADFYPKGCNSSVRNVRSGSRISSIAPLRSLCQGISCGFSIDGEGDDHTEALWQDLAASVVRSSNSLFVASKESSQKIVPVLSDGQN